MTRRNFRLSGCNSGEPNSTAIATAQENHPIYRDLLPKLAPVLRDLPPDLVEPAVA